MENEKSTGNKYTVKDAAIIGIFCAVMFVVFMVYSTLTGASLFYSMIFNAAGAALILAPFYVYMCMKVGKHGPALVYNIMWAIIAGLMMGAFNSVRNSRGFCCRVSRPFRWFGTVSSMPNPPDMRC